MNRLYPLVALRASHRCEYCHAPESLFNFPFEVEHIVLLTAGGGDEEENLALSCRSCNLYKAAFLEGTDPDTERTESLFNPRWQTWNEHFDVRSYGRKTEITPLASEEKGNFSRIPI